MFSSAKKEINQKELSSSSNIIGKGTNVEGSLNTSGNLRVEGRVNGDIQTKAKAVLGDTSVVEGSIIAQNAEIGGKVHGTIKVSGLLTLKATAVVEGNITASKLVFEAGARFDGKCSMGTSLENTKVAQPITHKKDSSPLERGAQQVILAKKGG